MQPSQYRHTIAGLLKNAVTDLLSSRVMHNRTIRIQGVLCLLVDDDNEDIVIKFHDTCRRRSEQKPMVNLQSSEANDSEVDLSSENISTSSNVETFRNVKNDDSCPEDLSMSTHTHKDDDRNQELMVKLEDEAIDMKAMILSSPSSDSGIVPYPDRERLLPVCADPVHSDQAGYSPCPERRRGRKAFSAKVTVHTGASHTPGGLSCNLCDTAFDSVQDCTQHYRSVHGHYLCHICLKTFSQSGSLTRHLRLHTGAKPFVCNECGLQFTRKDALVKHKVKYHRDCEHRCPLCDVAFDSRPSLRSHFKEQHGTDNVYLCPNCSLSFVGWGEYLSHTRSCMNGASAADDDAVSSALQNHDEME